MSWYDDDNSANRGGRHRAEPPVGAHRPETVADRLMTENAQLRLANMIIQDTAKQNSNAFVIYSAQKDGWVEDQFATLLELPESVALGHINDILEGVAGAWEQTRQQHEAARERLAAEHAANLRTLHENNAALQRLGVTPEVRPGEIPLGFAPPGALPDTFATVSPPLEQVGFVPPGATSNPPTVSKEQPIGFQLPSAETEPTAPAGDTGDAQSSGGGRHRAAETADSANAPSPAGAGSTSSNGSSDESVGAGAAASASAATTGVGSS